MSRATKEVFRHVALLRGINVGGKNSLPMKTLVAMFEDAGCEEVATYIQSGNVVFSASDKIAETIAERIGARIAKDLKLAVPVITRTQKECAAAIKGNPFLKRGEPEDKVHLMCLADRPSAAAVATLDAKRSPGDEFAVVGREVYLFLPNGVGKSKLTNAYFDAKLKTVSTIRNWRTVMTLVEML